VLILERDTLVAKGLKTLVSEIRIEVETKYALDVEGALEAVAGKVFDLFVIGVSSAKNDAGLRFAKIIRQTAEYKMVPIVFLADVKDKEIKRIIVEAFYGFRFFTAPVTGAIEEAFKETVSVFSGYKISRRDEGYITVIHNGKEQNINLPDILWADIENRVVALNMVDGKVHKFPHSDYSIKKLGVKLGSGFIHIHRSTIVNKRYIKGIDYQAGWLKLEGVERTFRLGITHMDSVKKQFGNDENQKGVNINDFI